MEQEQLAIAAKIDMVILEHARGTIYAHLHPDKVEVSGFSFAGKRLYHIDDSSDIKKTVHDVCVALKVIAPIKQKNVSNNEK